MIFDPKKHHRKSIRLKEYDYTTPWWYYVTICTNHHKRIFGTIKNGKMILNENGKIVEDEWIKTEQIREYVELDYYVIMPNHFHGIIIIGSRDKARLVPTEEKRKFGKPVEGSLPTIIGSFKSAVTKHINKNFNTPVIKIWQRNYYEHIIRNDPDLHNIRKYIELNPLKWELDEYYS